MKYKERFVEGSDKVQKQEGYEYYVDWGYELPKNYSRERIVALVRDPQCIFVYWSLYDISKYDKEKICLRVNNISDRKKWLIENAGFADNWYIAVESDREYFVELCYVDEKGIKVLMKSNKVRTPRDKIFGYKNLSEKEEFLKFDEGVKKQLGRYWSQRQKM